jgi:hypothetical protein
MSAQDDARAYLDATREQLRPAVQKMMDGARQAYTAAATLAGDPITAENEGFWQITGNLFVMSRCQLRASGPEIAELVTVAKAIADATTPEDWAGAAGICRRLFDAIDGGEELGLSDVFDIDWHDPAQRETALRAGMQFHRVPRSYQRRLADVVARLMIAASDTWMYEGKPLPQPWAQACAYVVYAVAERVTGATAFH